MANSNGWGDGAANNSIGWGQGANNNIGWGDSHAKSWAGATDIVGITTDSDAQAFITAAAITDPTQQTAINNLVVGMKADGIWTKMKAVYPFVGGTATAHKWNLKDPRDLDAAFRLVFNGGWTHSNNGAQGNGVNSFANPFLSSSANLQLNSAHVSYYSRTNSAANMVMMGTQSLYVLARWTQYHANNSVESDQGGISTGNTTAGFFMSNRTNGTAMKYQINGTIQTDSTSTAALATLQENPSLYLGCQNTLLYGVRLHNNYQTAFSTIGDGLTDTEAANLYTRVQAFQTQLFRQV
jgi:hypothetical protein